MATTYNSNKYASTIPARAGVNDSIVVGSYVMTTSFTSGDTVNLCRIPEGAAITQIVLDLPSLGTGTGATVSVGDSAATYATTGQTTRLISNAALTTAATYVNYQSSGTSGGLGKYYTTADVVVLNIVTGAQTGTTTGTLNFLVSYTTDR